MRFLVLAAVVLTAPAGHGIERPCTEGKIWDQNLGACVEAKAAAKASPRDSYNRALSILEGKSGTRRAIPLLSSACKRGLGAACTQLGAVYKTGRHVKENPTRSLASYTRGCDLKDVPGCLGAAEHHAKGLGGREDFGKALSFHRSACELGSGAGCYRAAEASLLGRGTKKDDHAASRGFANAARILERECRADNGPSCYLLGLALLTGRGLPRSPSRAFAILAKGCEAGSGDACYQKAVAIRDGEGTRANRTAAQRVFEDACYRYDSGTSCFAAGQLLASRGIDDDEKKPLERLGQRACELDKKHCLLLARLLDTEVIGKPNPKRSLELTTRACDHGNGLACFDIALKHLEGPERFRDQAQGLTRLRRACTLQTALACEQLAIYHDTGENVPKSPTRSMALRASACELGYGPSCTEGGRAALEGRGGRKADGKRALAFFAWGCSLRDGESCHLAATVYLEGQGGIGKDIKPAMTYFKGGCRHEFSSSCTQLGQLFDEGKSIKKNRARARQWYLRACDYGDEQPCSRAADLTPARSALRKRVASRIDGACNRESPNEGACMVMARQLSRGGNLFERDERRAFRIVEPSCTRRKYHPACVFLADLYRLGRGTIRDKKRSEEILKDYCRQDIPSACTMLAHTYLADGSYRAALPLYWRACRDGDPSACNNYAYHHYIGQGAPWDVKIATEYWEKACNAGSATGCANLGESYEHGIGVAENLAKAVSLYRGSCTLASAAGCGPLGHLTLTGKVVRQDRQLGLSLLKRACNNAYLPNASACRWLVEYYRGQPKGAPPRAQLARWAQRAYDLAASNASNPFALYLLGTFHRDGFAAVRDHKRATELFVKACDGYEPLACIAAGDAFARPGERQSLQRASVYYNRACAAEMKAGCNKAERVRAGEELPLAPGKGANGCACRATGKGGGAPWWLVGVGLLALRRRRR